jgi:subtilisin family serine protease
MSVRSVGGLFALLLIAAYPATGQPNVTITRAYSAILDPALEQMVMMRDLPSVSLMAPRICPGSTTAAASTIAPIVDVLIRGDERVEAGIRAVGGRTGTRHGRIVTAAVPLDALRVLAVQAGVEAIEGPRAMFPSLNVSVPSTGADVLHAQADPAKRLTGKGVILGFTDSGINTPHPAFRTTDGRTRILAVWDQSGSGTPPSGFSYGALHDSSDINARRWWMYDLAEHGTHVAGIAAGNGRPDGVYVGMAPEADIIMVCNRGDDLWSGGLTTVGTLDGYDFIRSRANALGKRHVINTSQGTNLGPHDGTSLFEQAVDADVAAGSVICLAAGNERLSCRHASAIVPVHGSVEVRFTFHTLAPFDSSAIPMEVWYNGADRISISCRKEPGDMATTMVEPGMSGVCTFDSAVVAMTSIVNSPLNHDNVIRCTVLPLVPVGEPEMTMVLRFAASGDGLMPGGGRIDLWWERNFEVRFVDHLDEAFTIGMPAGARSAISVGSSDNAASAPGTLSSFSACGPSRNGELKPDITAPGGGVMSAVPGGGIRRMSGTSMAAPHVAGAAALLLQHEPGLSPGLVKDRLCLSAAQDEATGSVPNAQWGHGRLNVWRALYGNVPPPASATMFDARQSGTDVILTWSDPSDVIQRRLVSVYAYRDNVRVDSVEPGKETWRDRSPGSGKHTYALVASWSDGWLSARSTELSVQVFFAASPWLIVDDDAGMPFETWYAAALDSAGVAWDRWETISAGTVTAEALLQYARPDGGVVWFCGSDYTASLTPAEQSALTAFLDAGGRLFISGQDIGYGLTVRGTDADRAFYRTYLKANLALDGSGVFTLSGDAAHFLQGEHFGITGGDGADDQFLPSAISPLPPAVPVLWYDTAGGATPLTGAIAYRGGTHTVVYFAFGFEAINSAPTRAEVMRKVVRYLTASDTVCSAVQRSRGWSLRSVPVRRPSMRVEDLFSAPAPLVYGYNGSYVPLDTLVCGQGVWVADGLDRQDLVCGDRAQPPDVIVHAGWNLIAPYHAAVSAEAITTTPPAILCSPFFGFARRYHQADILLPGAGYWVKALRDGVMHLGE